MTNSAANSRPEMMPAMSVPCGFTPEKLPVGLQLFGRPFEEEALMRIARAYEQATSWHAATPPLTSAWRGYDAYCAPMTTAILLSTFLISIVALLFFIVAVSRGWFDSDARGARVIFATNEIGKPEDPAAGLDTRTALDAKELEARAAADTSSSTVALVFMCAAVVWLLLGSFAGDLALTLGAWSGVLISGAMLQHFDRDTLERRVRQGFEYKGRFTPAMRSASSSVFSPGANCSHSGWPK